jgi:hypothetical protein
MLFFGLIYRRWCRAILMLVLLSTGNISFSQNLKTDGTIAVSSPTAIVLTNDSSGFSPVFLDSLKSKTSKNRLMKKLYDFVIVQPKLASETGFTGKSEEGFVTYSGVKIRRIEIRRLDVFGTNINNPVDAKQQGMNNVLNKSHVNTNEKIIRKNLLFSEGDTISPLNLSENERILRELPFIDDARIIIVPVSGNEADITVLTKDVYSMGASLSYRGLKKGAVSVFEKNIFGTGHEFGIDIPYNSSLPGSPGFGAHYRVNNIAKSFMNLNGYYLNGLGQETYGIGLNRKLVSAETKYAGGITVLQMNTTEDLDTLPVPEPLKYSLQDYWLQRSFLIDRNKVSRVILGVRYTNNNVSDRPYILPDSYYNLQNYRLYLASVAFSVQKFYKTKLIYGYGRTEDIPYGSLIKFTAGKEYNEFNGYRERIYLGSELAFGNSLKTIGYFYASAGIAAFINGSQARQGLMTASLNYFSNLLPVRNSMIRNFLYVDYTRGFDRNIDEHLLYNTENGFSGFRNDSVCGNQRLTVSIESVLFSPVNLYGFKFAFFGFADLAFISGKVSPAGSRSTLSGVGIGIRLRNDNLVFNTLQIRIGFFPNPPEYSRINYIVVSGEQLLKPPGFDSGPPSIIPYR